MGQPILRLALQIRGLLLYFFYYLLYLTMCILIGAIGRKLPLGFVGFFILAFFFSPLIGIILLVVLAGRAKPKVQHADRA